MKKQLTFLVMVLLSLMAINVSAQTVTQLVDYGQGTSSKGNPAFAYYGNYVYILYTAGTDSGRVCRYDMDTGSSDWSGDLFPTIAADDQSHNDAAIAVDGDGFIHCWIGMHNHKMKYYRSNSAGSYNSFTDQSATMPGYNDTGLDERRYTYPWATTSTNGDVFFIARRTGLYFNGATLRERQYDEKQDLYHWNNITKTWTMVLLKKQDGRNAYMSQIYGDENNSVHIVTVWSQLHSGDNTFQKGTYLRYDVANDKYYKADGTEVGIPIDVDSTNADLFYPGEQAWGDTTNEIQPPRVTINRLGRPVVTFAYNTNNYSQTNPIYRLDIAQWTGSAWNRVTNLGDMRNHEKPPVTDTGDLINAYARDTNDAYIKSSTDDGVSYANSLTFPDGREPKDAQNYTGSTDLFLNSRHLYKVVYSGSNAFTDLSGLDSVRTKYRTWLLGTNPDYTIYGIQQRYNALKNYFSSANTEYDNFTPSGSGQYDLEDTDDYNELKHIFANILFPLAYSYHLQGPSNDLNPYYYDSTTLERILILFEYLNSRGWTDGIEMKLSDGRPFDSDLNTYTPFANTISERMAGYAHAVLIMRDELKAVGLFYREMATLDWATRIIQPQASGFSFTYTGFNTDGLREVAMHRFVYILAQDFTDATRIANMDFLKTFLDNALSIAYGWSDMIKPDYLGYHHKMVYATSYVPEALHQCSIIAYLLSESSWDLAAQSKTNLKQSLLAHRLIANKYDVPVGTAGRAPDAAYSLIKHVSAYGLMALAGNTVDNEMAAAFLRMYDVDHPLFKSKYLKKVQSAISWARPIGELDTLLTLSESYSAEPDPSGHWVKPYAAMSVHRRNEWMVTVKGYSKNIISYEQSSNEHVYGRYSSYGSISLLTHGSPVDETSSGIVEDGWDWARIPGVTALKLSLAVLKGSTTYSDQNGHRKFSDQSFVGGGSLDDLHGVFAMKHYDAASSAGTRVNKSMFFFNDQIICLGSNIINGDGVNQTETTLFQSNLSSASTPIYVDSTSVSTFPYTFAASGSNSITLMDPIGNGFYLPNRTGVNIIRSSQSSIDNSGATNTQGDFATAWIDHGKNPNNEDYEYVMLIKTDAASLQDFANAAASKYTVLKKDSTAHIVRHEELDITGYALFQSGYSLLADSLLRGADKPSIVMLNHSASNLKVSVCNPEFGRLDEDQFIVYGNISRNSNLALTNAQSTVQKVQIKVKGNWDLSGSPSAARIINRIDSNTVIEFDCFDAQSLEAELIPYNGPLPVELSSFSALVNGNSVKLQWGTETETNNFGFSIQRASGAANNDWQEIGFVNGHGNSTSPKKYFYVDESPTSVIIKYRLKQVDLDGTFEYSKVIEVNMQIPDKYQLYQNFPNPFNPSTTIKFDLPEPGRVKLSIYNILGEEVAVLIDSEKEAGYHAVAFDGSRYASGLYIYRLKTDSHTGVKKMFFLK